MLPAACPVPGGPKRIALFLFSSSREKVQVPHAWLLPTGLSLSPQCRRAQNSKFRGTTYTVQHLQKNLP